MPHETELNCCQTHPKNANAHPVQIVLQATSCCQKEEIVEEKVAKKKRRQMREEKKATEKVAVVNVANFENRLAIEHIEEESMFPWRQSNGKYKVQPLMWDVTVPQVINKRWPHKLSARPKTQGGLTKVLMNQLIKMRSKDIRRIVRLWDKQVNILY